MSTKPVLKALVLADQIYQDARTQKWIIAGTFTQITGPRIPIITPQIWVYLSLTDFRGECEIRLEIKFDDTDEVLAQTNPLRLKMENPLQTFEVALPIPPMTLHRPGIYSINVIHDEEILGSHRITVQLTPERS